MQSIAQCCLSGHKAQHTSASVTFAFCQLEWDFSKRVGDLSTAHNGAEWIVPAVEWLVSYMACICMMSGIPVVLAGQKIMWHALSQVPYYKKEKQTVGVINSDPDLPGNG